MTKPRPDQPGRWRKGSPRIEWDRERADRLQEEVEEYDATLTRQSDLLTRTVNALRGDPPPLTSWSHHDIPELAAEKVAEVALLIAERDALAAQVALVEALAEEWERDAEDQLRNCYSGRDVFEGERTVQIVSELRAALAGPEANTSDVDVCSGDAYCTSALHVHGCFADTAGPCTDPDEHQPTDQDATGADQ